MSRTVRTQTRSEAWHGQKRLVLEAGREETFLPGDRWTSRLERVVTLEVALHLGAVAIGVFLRLLLLDARPLSAEEGALALESHRLMVGSPPESVLRGPLPAYGVALALAMFAGGDGAARLPSALLGAMLVGAPYLIRHGLGRAAALIAAYGLALSPLMLFASRHVDGGTVPLVLGFLLLWVATSDAKAIAERRPYLAALLLGGLVASGPAGITVGLSIGVAAVLSHPSPSEMIGDLFSKLSRTATRRYAVLTLAVALAIGTGLGSNPVGVQWVAVDVWAQWLGNLTLVGPRGWLISALGLYELPVTLLGGMQLLVSIRRRDRTDMFLSLWAVLALLLAALQGMGSIGGAALPLLPLYLLAARMAADGLGMVRRASFGWLSGIGLLSVLVPLAVGLVLLNRASTPATAVPVEYVYGEMALVVLAGLVLGLLLEGRHRRAVVWSVLVLLSVGYLLHSSVFLNYRAESWPRELVMGRQPSAYLRTVASDAAYFSRYFGARVTIDPQLRDVTGWYLREARDVQYSTEARDGIVVLLAERSQQPSDWDRMPGVYSPAIDPTDASWQGVWRWAVFREGLVRANPRDIIVRAPMGRW